MAQSLGIYTEIYTNKITNQLTIKLVYDCDKSSEYKFTITPYNDTHDYYGFTLSGNHMFLLGDFTVTHNTITMVKVATKIRLPTLFAVNNKIILMDQIKESIEQFCESPRIQMLTNSKDRTIQPNMDFYIANTINLPKYRLDELRKHIRVVILDECHTVVSEKSTIAILNLHPKYMIGLSATPYRYDDKQYLIEAFFGNNVLTYERQREHTVIVVRTSFSPVIEKTKNNQVNWSKLLNDQANDIERNLLICQTAANCVKNGRIILILIKRVSHGDALCNILFTEYGLTPVDIDRLYGNNNNRASTTSKIIIGMSSKVGTGFDCARVNTLFVVADLENYFIQFLGRVFRDPNVKPKIYEFVDQNHILQKHFNSRRGVYQEAGGTVIESKNFGAMYLPGDEIDIDKKEPIRLLRPTNLIPV